MARNLTATSRVDFLAEIFRRHPPGDAKHEPALQELLAAFRGHVDVRRLNEELERIQEAKEDAVAGQDWETAVRLRDQGVEVRKGRQYASLRPFVLRAKQNEGRAIPCTTERSLNAGSLESVQVVNIALRLYYGGELVRRGAARAKRARAQEKTG